MTDTLQQYKDFFIRSFVKSLQLARAANRDRARTRRELVVARTGGVPQLLPCRRRAPHSPVELVTDLSTLNFRLETVQLLENCGGQGRNREHSPWRVVAVKSHIRP
jgi:hypothetical protein